MSSALLCYELCDLLRQYDGSILALHNCMHVASELTSYKRKVFLVFILLIIIAVIIIVFIIIIIIFGRPSTRHAVLISRIVCVCVCVRYGRNRICVRACVSGRHNELSMTIAVYCVYVVYHDVSNVVVVVVVVSMTRLPLPRARGYYYLQTRRFTFFFVVFFPKKKINNISLQ